MKFRSPILLFICIATLGATPPKEPGPVLPSGFVDLLWAPLFKELAEPRTIFSTFTEQRWFGFKKTPVVLEGEMRLDPSKGLSLRYVKPDERLMIIDSKGVLLRDAKGRKRELPSDPRAGGIEKALLPALRFDLDEIRTYFVIHAVMDGPDWRIDLEPIDPNLSKTLGNLTIEGNDSAVKRLEFRRAANQRVVIIIKSTQERVRFAPEDFHRYFR